MASQSDLMKNNKDHPCLAQLMVLNEHDASLQIIRSDLPVRIGRAADCQLRSTAKGVWKYHVELDLNCDNGFFLRPVSKASTLINDEPLKGEKRLANGDLIILGLMKIQFQMGPVRQQQFDTRETLYWMVLAAFMAAQVWLIRWLG
jgi:predicted component of type VI protein secretion system